VILLRAIPLMARDKRALQQDCDTTVIGQSGQWFAQ
jgi:hypothetical protein